MQKLEIEVPETYWNYQEPYQFIATFLKSKGLTEIGDITFREQYRMPNGEIRAASMDIGKEERAMRSLTISKLSHEEIGRIHEYELNHMARLLSPQEMVKVLKKYDYAFTKGITASQFESLYRLGDQSRPNPKKFHGVSIPAYFPLDNTFDGMIYHHEWDLNVKGIDFTLSEDRPVAKIANKFKVPTY